MNDLEAFACTRCGACCRVPGYVRVSDDDVMRIAAYLECEVAAFTAKQTRLMPDRSGLALLEEKDGTCAFLAADGKCRIQPVKPGQCCGFPYTWRYPDMTTICEGWKE